MTFAPPAPVPFPRQEALRTAVLSSLADIPIAVRRLELAIPEGEPVPLGLLRGVLGAALHDVAPHTYETVFAPTDDGAVPSYVLRFAPPGPGGAIAVETTLIGEAVRHAAQFEDAWREAGARGLGADRKRFAILADRPLTPEGRIAAEGLSRRHFTLADVTWPLAGDAETPCRILFDAPLRILRKGTLVRTPTLRDLVVAARRRVMAFLPERSRGVWTLLGPNLLEACDGVPCLPWVGADARLSRWSSSQQRRIELHGVQGYLDLPCGPGELLPLLSAMRWMHIGKGATFGLGQAVIAVPWGSAPDESGQQVCRRRRRRRGGSLPAADGHSMTRDADPTEHSADES